MGSATTSSGQSPRLAVTSVKIEVDKLDAFKQIAAANRRSMSQELRWLIDRHIEAAELERAA